LDYLLGTWFRDASIARQAERTKTLHVAENGKLFSLIFTRGVCPVACAFQFLRGSRR